MAVGATRVCASADKKNIAVLGASGYTGAEVVRLLALHPHFDVACLTGDSKAGMRFSDVFPHLLTATDVPALVKIADVDWSKIDGAFCCLPHATTQATLASLPPHVKVVDLSADFRLKDVKTYAEWYGGEHQAPELQKEAVYGLTELNRAALLGKPRLVANPGCYPTCVQLGLVPLLEKGLISTEDIIIDAKSGISGAGRSAKQNLLYCEATEGVNAYGITRHRHMPEIEQGLSEASGKDVRVSFTPHLMPMSRGMETASYVKLADGVSVADLRAALEAKYEAEPFVHVLAPGMAPFTHHVRGTNNAMLNVFEDRLEHRAIVIGVIDNLVKGASGQALVRIVCELRQSERRQIGSICVDRLLDHSTTRPLDASTHSTRSLTTAKHEPHVRRRGGGTDRDDWTHAAVSLSLILTFLVSLMSENQSKNAFCRVVGSSIAYGHEAAPETSKVLEKIFIPLPRGVQGSAVLSVVPMNEGMREIDETHRHVGRMLHIAAALAP